MKHDSCDLGT